MFPSTNIATTTSSRYEPVLSSSGRSVRAVDFAHKNLIVHRDLKPDNIWFLRMHPLTYWILEPRSSLSPESALTGVQAGSQSNLTVHGYQSFTPQFASPEQVLGEPITTASDSYSLGVLLFLLLTDVHPYELRDFSTAEMIRVVCHEQPPRPSHVATHTEKLDSDLDAITLKALRKEPGERYQTVYQLIADVDAYLDGRPVAARRGTLRYRTGKFLRTE